MGVLFMPEKFREISELLEKKFIGIEYLHRELTLLSRLYNIRRESEVFEFLEDKPSLIPLVVEAHERIRDYFGSSTELVLEVITDPEATEDYELVIFVRTNLSPDDAFSKLEQLDEEWWLDASSEIREKLCIHMESSVSRAYYAAFCKARNYLRDIEGRSIPSTGDAHVFVRDEFRYSADRLRRKIGNNLNRLRIDRNKVDYDDSVTGLSSMVTMDLTIALKVISTLNTL